MRRFPAVVPVMLILGVFAGLAGCGGGHKSSDGKTGVPTTISVSTSNISLNAGTVTLLAASVLDGNGTPITANLELTFASTNPAVASLSPTVLSGATAATTVCGGSWDASFVVCKPGPTGTTQVVAKGMGLTSTPVSLFVHPRVDSVVISPSSVNCLSKGQTQQFTAKAFGNGVDLTSSVGPFTWSAETAGVVTLDNTTNNGLATATAPGRTNVFASLSNSNSGPFVVSPPASFTTCPIQSISVHIPNSTDTFVNFSTLPGQQTLAIDAVDSNGVTVSSPPVTMLSTFSNVGSANTTTAFGSGPGSTAIVAACTPPSCNANLFQVFSNPFIVNASGTSASTVYAASTTGTSLVPIDTTNNTAGTAVTLPSQPNSTVFAPDGTKLYLGSSGGIMVVDTSSNAVTQNTTVAGSVLGISPDGSTLAVVNASAGTISLVNAGTLSATTASATTLNIPGATKVAFTLDSSKILILAGSTLTVVAPSTTTKTIALGGNGSDVSVAVPGWFSYVAQGGIVSARATCDNSLHDSLGVGGNATLLARVPNGSKMLAVNSPAIDVITPHSDGAGCPPSLSDGLAVRDLGQGSFTARQVFVLSDSSKAYVIGDGLSKLLVYDIAADAPSTIALAGGANAFSGGATLDSKTVYVGGSDNAVHRIDVASATDAQQISLSFTPDLVAVKPK